jgi:hypothetical protein
MKTNTLLFVLLLLSLNISLLSQQNKFIEVTKSYFLSSGAYDGSNLKNPEEAYKDIIAYPSVNWIRIVFESTSLGRGSYIVIKSLEDNYNQIINSVVMEQGGFTSAYFNGDSLSITLFVSPGDKNVFFNIAQIFTDEKIETQQDPEGDGPDEIEDLCGYDDRVRSF